MELFDEGGEEVWMAQDRGQEATPKRKDDTHPHFQGGHDLRGDRREGRRQRHDDFFPQAAARGLPGRDAGVQVGLPAC